MLYTKNYRTLLLLATLLILQTACQKDEDVLPSIASIAVTNPDFSTLEDAAVLGGVAAVLSNPNPNDPEGAYTVFAPNNAAFARLGFNSGADLRVLQPSFLTSTLLYHVSGGNLPSSRLTNNSTSASALGPVRRVVTRGNERYINGSKILATDIRASNGTVHVIDKVLLATGADIVQSALALRDAKVFIVPELSFLVEAVLYAELADALTAKPGSPSFTVFAPTDAAFKQLGQDLGVPLNVPADVRKLPKDVVTNVLLNHVIADGGKFMPEMNAGSVTPLGGSPLTIGAFTNGVVSVKGKSNNTAANVVIPDVLTTNGVVHVIDRVLLP